MTFEAGRKKQILVLQPKGKPLYESKLLQIDVIKHINDKIEF